MARKTRKQLEELAWDNTKEDYRLLYGTGRERFVLDFIPGEGTVFVPLANIDREELERRARAK